MQKNKNTLPNECQQHKFMVGHKNIYCCVNKKVKTRNYLKKDIPNDIKMHEIKIKN